MTAYDGLYLAPHLDDVVLSCGGTIHRRAREGRRALVITLFAGSPDEDANTAFSLELKERWGALEDPVGVRRHEDLEAVTRLGAEAAHLPFLDCVYRRGPVSGADLYPTVEHIFGDVHPEEAALHEVLLAALDPYLAASPRATVYAPLTVGHHVDHLVTLRAVRVLHAAGRRVRLYEDYPYAVQPDEVERALALLRAEGLVLAKRCRCFGPEDLEAKADAIACYRSQISTFWQSLAEMRRDIEAYARTVGDGELGEAFWRIGLPDAEANAQDEGDAR